MFTLLSRPKDNVKQSAWPLWAYGLGLMVMPDNLALASQFAGQLGIFAPLILAVSVLIFFSFVRCYANLNPIYGSTDSQEKEGPNYLGTWLVYYPLVIRFFAAILLATGLTVSSGFVFNEVFVYWFPNFAFAFMLLAGMGGLQLLRKTHRSRAQLVFVSTVLLGLAILVVTGLITGLFQDRVRAIEAHQVTISGLFLPLLLLLGFDIGIYPGDNSLAPPPESTKILKRAIAVFAGFLIFWVMTALLHVDGLRLANTSIAHLISAREIGGQAGRVIMGVMIIAGSCAAVNALFEGVVRLTQHFSRKGMLPQMNLLPKASVLVMTAVAAFLMTSGLAGEELLESLIRVTLLMWLGHYGLITAKNLLGMCQKSGSDQGVVHGQNRFQLMATAIITFAGILVLVLTGDQPMLMVAIMIVTICAVLIAGGIYTTLRPSRSG